MSTEMGTTDLMTAQPGELAIDRHTCRLPEGQYVHEETAKSLVVLHFTAGSTARGAFQSWVADKRRVAAAYIVDADGDVFEVFDPRYWAYALGIAGPSGGASERRAVQIEMVNWGPLQKKGDVLYSWPANYGNRYCQVSENSRYTAKTARGMSYYAAFPAAQVAAVARLTLLVCGKFKIPLALPPPAKRGIYDLPWFSQHHGIAAHENARQDKFDVGPAFPWLDYETALRP